MCYNKETSLATFLGSLVVSGLLIYRNNSNDKFIALFLLALSSMQLAEFFIWNNINNKEKNKFFTRIANIIIILQPIVVLFGLYNFGNLIISNSMLFYPLIISLFYTLYLWSDLFNSPYKLSVVSKVNKHLSWGQKDIFPDIKALIFNIFYSSIIIFGPLLLKPRYVGYIITLIIIITLLLSYIKTRKEIDIIHKSSWKSLWCFMAPFMFLLYYLLTGYLNLK